MKQMSDKEVSKRLAVVLTERIRPELMTCEEVVATGRYPYTGQLGILTKKDWEKVWEAMRIFQYIHREHRQPDRKLSVPNPAHAKT